MVATTLSAGSLAVIHVNSDDPGGVKADTVSFVLLEPIEVGTAIHFTDRTWTHSGSTLNSGSFSTSGTDGTYTYTATQNLPAGSIINISTAQLNAAGINLSDTGEALYVYQGTTAVPTGFLHAIEFGDGNAAFSASLTNTGLTAGTHTASVAGDNATYADRGHNIQISDLLGRIGNAANWSYNDNSPHIPQTGNFFSAPDQVVWAAHPGPGGLTRIYRDGTDAGTQQATTFENPATPTQHFYHPNDIVFDTAHGLFFVADSDQGNRRILQGSISDLMNPGVVPTLKVIYQDNDPTTAGGQFNGIAIDTEHGSGVGALYFVNKGNFNRVTYDHDGTTTENQTPTLLGQLPAGSFANEIALDIANNRAWILSTASHTEPYEVPAGTPGALYDADSGLWYKIGTTIANNEIWQVGGLDRTDTGIGGTTTTRLDLDLASAGFDLPNAKGLLSGMDYHNGSIYFVTQQWAGGTEGTGGVYTYNLSNGAITNLYAETTSTDYAFEYIDVDPVTGRYYISNVSFESPGDPNGVSVNTSSIFSGVIGTGGIALFVKAGNINSSAPQGLITLNAPTINSTANTGLAVTEASSGPGSGTTSPLIAPIATIDAGDGDTTNHVDQLGGAQMRISDNYQSGATHQDQLTINGQTSGTLIYGSKTITFAFDAVHGVMTLSGPATFDNYENALKLIRFSTSGDDVTAYGTAHTRTLSWSVFDGALYSDETHATVSVTGINDAPVNSVGAAMNFVEDTTGHVGAAGVPPTAPRNAVTGISVNDVDADPATQDITVTLSVGVGTLSIRTDVTGGIAPADVISGNGTGTIVITATQNQINATLAAMSPSFTGPPVVAPAPNGLIYTAPTNYNGATNLTITTNDNGLNGNDPGNSGTGTSEQDTDVKIINIADVNDAPTVSGDGSEKPAAIFEDLPLSSAAAPTVANVFGGQFADAVDVQVSAGNPTGSAGDAFAGILVVTNGSSAALGQWQYWNGASWQNIGAPGAGEGIFVRADAPIRFEPALDYNGAAPQLVAHLVEASGDTPATSGTGVNLLVTPVGGTSHISNGTVTLDQDITAVNDAPVIVNGATATLTTIVEDAASPAGDTVANLFASHFDDSKDDVGDSVANTFSGVLVTADASGASDGVWQVNTGSGWTALGSVPAEGIVLTAATQVRFVPAADFNGAVPALTVKLVDSGGAVSTGTMTLGQSVTAVNDEPGLTPGGNVQVDEDHGAFSLADWATNITAGAANESGQTLTITATVTSGGGLFSVAPAIDELTGELTFTTAANAHGAATVEVVVTDDGGTANTGDDTSQTYTFDITIDAVNDAPVNSVGGTANAAEDGPAVALSGISISDPDADPATDVVTVELSVGNGTLTLDDNVAGGLGSGDISGQGTDKLTLTGTLDAINATLAAANALMYTPDADFSGTDGLTVLTDDGGASGGAAEQDSDVKAIDVAATNDAPTLANDATLTGTNEDNASAGESVADVLASAGYADSDGPSEGMAVTGLTGNGTWQYSTDGGANWHSVGAVSEGSALLLSGTALLRYVPDGESGETPTISFRGWDGSTGTATSGATRGTADTTTNGDDTAFSTGTVDGSLTVTSLNDAPTVGGDGTEMLAAVDEDSAAPAGATVDTLFSGQFADVDTGDGFAGVAVVGSSASASEGVWQYHDGTSWVSLASAASDNAVLLAPDAKIRFLPAADFSGPPPSLIVHLVDDSAGAVTTGDIVDLDTAGTGGTTRYSDGTVALDTTIDAIADAPTGADADLAAINEDTAAPAGESISSLFGGSFDDPDGNSLAGIAITDNSATAAEGVWQYHDGATWVDIGSPTTASALELDASTLVRFVPAANFNGAAPALSGHLIDSSAGSAATGTLVDVTSNGGLTPYSDDPVTIGQAVTAVNDRPSLQLSSVGPSATLDYVEDSGAQTITPTAVLGDIDSANFGGGSLIVSFDANGQPTDQLGIKDDGTGAGAIGLDGSNVTYGGVVIGTVSGGTNGTDLEIQLDSDATVAAVEALIQNVTYDTSSDAPSTLQRTVHYEVRDGDGGDEMAQGNAVVNLTIANDNPDLDVPGAQTGAEDTPFVFSSGNSNAITISDGDIGSGLATVVLSVPEGTLTLGSTAGLAGVLDDGTGLVTLVGSVAAINNALEGLTYVGAADSNGARDLTIGVSDNGFTGPNLIVNPGAEIGPSAADYSSSEAPFGWTLVSGTLTALQYDIAGQGSADLDENDSAGFGGGNDYFAGGPSAPPTSAVAQQIDVSGEAARIDGGEMIANLSGLFGGYLAAEDTMVMTVRFLDENGDELDSTSIGGPSAADRGGDTKMLAYAGAASVPVGTRSIEVVLTATNADGLYGDGYADRLSLTLSELVTDTVSIDLAAGNDPVGVAAGPDVSVAEEGSVAIGGLSISDVDAVLAPDGEYTVTLSAADGTLTVGTPTGLDFTAGDGTGDATMTFHGTLAEVNAALATVSFTGAEDFVGNTDVDISVTDQTGAAVATGSGAATTATDSVGVTVTAVNDAPVIDLDSGAAGSGATLAYTENGPAARIAPDATLTDPDSADYDGGSLEVEFTGNGDGDDRLTISDGGGITVAGGAVSYNGTEIGSVTGGTSGSDPLQISFNSSASVAAVQAVLQQVSYANVSDTPSVLARTITYTLTDNDGGTETGTAVATVNVAATDDNGTAADDAFGTDEATAITGENVLDNDDDIDSTLEVGSVEGVAGNVGNQFALASGALVTLEADGTLSYDANGAFDHLAQTGSGAQNVQATDSFSYTLTDGTSATVTITIDGLVSDPHRLIGSSGNDDITGTSGVDLFRIEQGGDDIAAGQGGDDVFNLGASFTGGDEIDGGTGYDMLKLSGDYYSVPLVLGSDTLRRVEMILLSGGNSYDLTTHDDNVAAGRTLVVSGAALSPLEELWFDGSAETDGAFRLLGGGCNDVLVGGARNDVLNGGIGSNLLAGGDGDDIYVVVGADDTIVELADQGFDAVRASVDYVLGEDLEALLLLGTAVLGVGNASDNLVIGNGGDNKLRGGDGHDMLAGDGGADNLQGNAGDDSLFGGAGADALFGSSGKDRLSGNNGADTLDAGTGDDRLYGGDANDILLAGVGNDILFGGGQRDTLTGGTGGDTFAFADGDMSALVAQADRITDFSAAQHDVIHLRQIDANENTAADDKFSFIGTGAFSGAAGELRYQVVGGDALLQGDTDGNGIADFFIRIEGVTVLTSGDIIG